MLYIGACRGFQLVNVTSDNHLARKAAASTLKILHKETPGG